MEANAKKSPRKKADKQQPPPGGNGHIEDITHEEVPINEDQGIKLEKNEVLVINEEDMIKRELVKFNYTDQKVQEMKTEFGALTIKDQTDKAGYEAVKKAWNVVRSVRTGFEKKGLELRNNYKKILTAISGEEDRLITLVTPLEDELLKKWKAFDDEKERLKKEKEEAEQKRLMTRLEELVALGMKLENGFYQIGETVSMDAATLRALPDEQYDKLKQTVQVKALQLAEEKRLKDEEEERKAQKLADDQKKLKEQQDALDKEKNEMKAQRREVRLGKLENLGMTLQAGPPEFMIYQDNATSRLTVDPLLEMEADKFALVVDAATSKIKDIKDEEAKKKQREENRRVRFLAMEALDFELIGDKFIYDDDYHPPFTMMAEMLPVMKEEVWREYLKSAGANILDMKNKKVKHDQEVAEEARLKEIKEKYIADAMQIDGFTYRYTPKDFHFKNESGELIVTWNDMLPLSDDEIALKASGLADEIRGLKKKADDAKKVKEAQEKKDKLLGMKDKDRLTEQLVQLEVDLLKIVPGEFKTATYQKRAQDLVERMTNLINEFKP